MRVQGLLNKDRGAVEEAEWPTGMSTVGEEMALLTASKIAKGLAEEGRAAEKERAMGERWATKERGATEERGTVEEAEWPTGVPTVREGMTAVGDHESACEEGEAVEKERAVKESGATEERGATDERGAAEEASWPTGMSAAGEGMAAVGDRERPCGGGDDGGEREGGRERESGGGERGHRGERDREGECMAHGHAGRRGGDGSGRRSRKDLQRKGGRWRKKG